MRKAAGPEPYSFSFPNFVEPEAEAAASDGFSKVAQTREEDFSHTEGADKPRRAPLRNMERYHRIK